MHPPVKMIVNAGCWTGEWERLGYEERADIDKEKTVGVLVKESTPCKRKKKMQLGELIVLNKILMILLLSILTRLVFLPFCSIPLTIELSIHYPLIPTIPSHNILPFVRPSFTRSAYGRRLILQ